MTYEEYSALAMDVQESICYIADPETHDLLYINRKGQEVLGLPGGTPRGKCYRLIQGKDAPCEFCSNARLEPGRFYRWEYYNPKLDRHFALQDTLLDLNGKTLRLELCQDITERKQAEEALKDRLSLEETLVRCVHTLTEEKDMKLAVDSLLSIVGEYYNANRAYIFEFHAATGTMDNTYEWCKAGVTSEIDHLQGLPLKYVDRWIERFEADGAFTITSLKNEMPPDSEEYRTLEAQGIQTLMAAPLVSKGKIIGFLGVDDPVSNMEDTRLLRSIPCFVQDDLEKRRMLAELERMSYIDALTGLYNRNKYMAELHALEDETPEPMGIVYLDINGLKSANDTYGHGYGDKLIMKAANVLRGLFAPDVFRIGGDEFVALFRNRERRVFEEKVETLRAQASADQDFSVSIGCTWTGSGHDIVKQVAHADELMYLDKQSYYKSLLNGSSRHRSGMARALLDDIEAGVFVVHLQPQVSLQDGGITGAEALVRRKGPSGSLIPPAKFIPVYEADGIIRHLDFFVLETVCASLAEGKQSGFFLPVSVNLSRITLMEHDIVQSIADLCRKYGVEPGLLHLEVTESIGRMESEVLAELIRGFREEGFSISLDDFGSEYSNLAILTSMDFSEIKFDKSLIKNLAHNPKSRIVLEHAIDMCHALNQTRTLAEGVETEAQKDILAGYRCQYGQGYLFSRPVPIRKFWTMYREQKRKKAPGIGA